MRRRDSAVRQPAVITLSANFPRSDTAFVPNLWWLVGVRFILGIGVGADYVLSPTIMSEHANARNRGRALGFGFMCMWPAGALAAALLTFLLQRLGIAPDLLWRIVLAGGAVPALAVLYLRRHMPETARFLARIAGGAGAAAQVVADVAGRVATPLPGLDSRDFRTTWLQHYRLILAAALLWGVFDVVVYSMTLFGPLLIAKGLGLGPVEFAIITNFLFSIPGALVVTFLADGMGRKTLQAGGLALGAVMMLLFAGMKGAVAASPLLGMLFSRCLQRGDAGPGAGYQLPRRRALAHPAAVGRPVDLGDRRTHRRLNQRIPVPLGLRTVWGGRGHLHPGSARCGRRRPHDDNHPRSATPRS